MKKAIDYYNEYKDEFFGAGLKLEDVEESLMNLVKDFVCEMEELQKVRHIKRLEAMSSVIKELNQKWNALVTICEKKHGVCPMRRDGFLKAIDVLTRDETSVKSSEVKKEAEEDAGTEDTSQTSS